MLVIHRGINETITVGDDVVIIVGPQFRGQTRIGIVAPREKAITRRDRLGQSQCRRDRGVKWLGRVPWPNLGWFDSGDREEVGVEN